MISSDSIACDWSREFGRRRTNTHKGQLTISLFFPSTSSGRCDTSRTRTNSIQLWRGSLRLSVCSFCFVCFALFLFLGVTHLEWRELQLEQQQQQHKYINQTKSSKDKGEGEEIYSFLLFDWPLQARFECFFHFYPVSKYRDRFWHFGYCYSFKLACVRIWILEWRFPSELLLEGKRNKGTMLLLFEFRVSCSRLLNYLLEKKVREKEIELKVHVSLKILISLLSEIKDHPFY